MRRPAVAGGAGALAVLALAPVAAAGLWSAAGGDSGRSGHQPVARGGAPFTALWEARGAADREVRTSPIVTAAGADGTAPRVAYGTAGGVLHLRELLTGRAVGPEKGIKLTEGPGTTAFSGFGGSVSPVDTSGPGGLGHVLAVVNDPAPAPAEGEDPQGDLVVAQVDARDGRLIKRARLPGTAKLVVSSSPVLSEPSTSGDRSLVVAAVDRADWREDYVKGTSEAVPQLLRIPIRRAAAPDAEVLVDQVQTSEVALLNPLASPSLVVMDDASGRRPTRPAGYVSVSTGDPDAPLKTAGGDDLSAAGPSSERLDPEHRAGDLRVVGTASVPVTPSGDPPGTGASGAGRAPAVLVAQHDADPDRTVVHRLVPNPDGTKLVEAARSAPLPGRPAPQLAVTQNGQAPGDGAGVVLVTTSRGLVALDGGDLSSLWRVDGSFAQTTAAVFGETAFVVRDDGVPLALRLADGRALGAPEFDPVVPGVSVSSYGSPAVTRQGIVVLGSDKGVAAFRARCANALQGNGRLVGTRAGDDLVGGARDDVIDAFAGDDCVAAGDGNDLVQGGEGADSLDLGAGADRGLGGDGGDVLAGQAGADRLNGQEGDDRLDGGFDNDVLKGTPGRDTLLGRDGADRLYGAAGADRLDGGPGPDRLSGGPGNDLLRGGPGRDVLLCGPGRDTAIAGKGDRVSRCERVR